MRLAVIIGSTRRGRFGPTVAGWLAHQAAKQFEVDLLVVERHRGTSPFAEANRAERVGILGGACGSLML